MRLIFTYNYFFLEAFHLKHLAPSVTCLFGLLLKHVWSVLLRFHLKWSKSHGPLASIMYKSFRDDFHRFSSNSFSSCFLSPCVCVYMCVHVHVHMDIMTVTHASLQPFVMSLFYSEAFYEVQIVWGFGDHQHNWQSIMKVFLFPALSWPVWRWEGLHAQAPAWLKHVFISFINVKPCAEQRNSRQKMLLNLDLFSHFKSILSKKVICIAQMLLEEAGVGTV